MTSTTGQGSRSWRCFAAGCLLAAGLLHTSALAAAPPAKPDCETHPAWCATGYVCQPTACAAESAAQLHLLTVEVDILRARKERRWRCVIGAGGGIAYEVRDGGTTFDAKPLPAALVCGWAF